MQPRPYGMFNIIRGFSMEKTVFPLAFEKNDQMPCGAPDDARFARNTVHLDGLRCYG